MDNGHPHQPHQVNGHVPRENGVLHHPAPANGPPPAPEPPEPPQPQQPLREIPLRCKLCGVLIIDEIQLRHHFADFHRVLIVEFLNFLVNDAVNLQWLEWNWNANNNPQ